MFGGRTGRVGPMASLVAAVNLVAGCIPVAVGPAGPAVPPPQVGPTLVLHRISRVEPPMMPRPIADCG